MGRGFRGKSVVECFYITCSWLCTSLASTRLFKHIDFETETSIRRAVTPLNRDRSKHHAQIGERRKCHETVGATTSGVHHKCDVQQTPG